MAVLREYLRYYILYEFQKESNASVASKMSRYVWEKEVVNVWLKTSKLPAKDVFISINEYIRSKDEIFYTRENDKWLERCQQVVENNRH